MKTYPAKDNIRSLIVKIKTCEGWGSPKVEMSWLKKTKKIPLTRLKGK